MKSFIEVDQESDFPIQNLPYGVFTTETQSTKHIGVAIGEYVLDITLLEAKGFLTEALNGAQNIFNQGVLNPFLALKNDVWHQVRKTLQSLLSIDNDTIQSDSSLKEEVLIPRSIITNHVPISIGDYTDFYASKNHATHVGTMFRGKDNALMPNWTSLPVGYHGRASSIVMSGTDVRRPLGQTKPKEVEQPIFGPSKQLDFEYEMGFIMGYGNQLQSPINVNEAKNHVFGMVIVNDWSARDIQAWEYQPLGPFLAKNFATSISPWVVTLEALETFKTEGPTQIPEPFDYLKDTSTKNSYNLTLETYLQTDNEKEVQIAQTNYNSTYWSIAQMVAHHTITGCNLKTGDLLATGTISGKNQNERGSLMEITWRGENPIRVNNVKRSWLEDGDTLTLKAYAQGENYRIGFGEVVGKILPAHQNI